MKVTVNTPRQLVIDNTPWVLGFGTILAILVMTWITLRAALSGDIAVAALVGACTLMFPAGMFVVLEREQLILDRNLGQIIVRRRSLYRGYVDERFPLERLRGPTMVFIDPPKRMREYRMVLALGPPLPDRHASLLDGAQRVVPFSDWTDEGSALQIIRFVEGWMASSAPERPNLTPPRPGR